MSYLQIVIEIEENDYSTETIYLCTAVGIQLIIDVLKCYLLLNMKEFLLISLLSVIQFEMS